MHRICNSDDTAAVENYRQWCLRRSVFLRAHQHLRVKGSFPNVQLHAERKGQRIYTKRKTLLIGSRQIHVSVHEEFPPTSIYCAWQSGGRDRQKDLSVPNSAHSYCKPASLHSRIDFCYRINVNPQKISNLFTDRVHFSRDGVNNTKKSYLQNHVIPHGRVRITNIALP